MARLPVPGSDDGTWGSILNDFLAQAHNTDGSVKSNTIGTSAIADSVITEAKLDSSVQTKLNSIAPVTSVNSQTGAVNLNKSDISLGNVDNTSDNTKNSATATLTNKTISGTSNTLTNISQGSITDLTTDLAAKTDDTTAVHNTGSETIAGVKTFSSSPIIPTPSTNTEAANKAYVDSVAGGGGPVTWGGISGTLGDQSDLQAAFNAKVDSSTTVNGHALSTNVSVTASDVGLGSVDNTSDATKNSASVTLTNKTISGSSNTLSNIAQSSVSNLTTDLGNKVNTTLSVSGASSLTGGGSLTTDRTITLINDSATPGNDKYYGTNGSGTKGYYDLPTGSGSIAQGTYVKVVAGSGESAGVKAAADYVCDGTSDQTEINAALAAVGTETINRGNNGGEVILLGRNFNISGPILVPTQATLRGGYGEYGTVITAVSGIPTGAQAGMIELATTDTQYVAIKDLFLNGAGLSMCGLYINVGTGQEYDSYIKVSDVYVWNVGQSGLRTENASGGRLRGNHFRNIRVVNAGTYGLWVDSPDSFYTNIDCGSSGSHGIYVDHANNRLVGCKAWYSDGSGFYCTSAGRDNQFTACESQDNEFHGYDIYGRSQLFSACTADSNSYDGSPSGAITGNSYHGFNVHSNGVTLTGCAANDKNEGSRGLRQQYGFVLASGIKVSVNGTAYNNAVGALSSAAAGTSVVDVVDAS